jgi:hypothetical protein
MSIDSGGGIDSACRDACSSFIFSVPTIDGVNTSEIGFLLSWAVSAFLGREYERRDLQKLSIPALLTRRQKIPSTDSMFTDMTIVDDVHSVTSEEEVDLEDEEPIQKGGILSSPLPEYPSNGGDSCWSKPENVIFRVRGATYLQDRIKIPSAPAPFVCRGVDIWLTDNPERHIARHPSVLQAGGGRIVCGEFLAAL